MKPTEGTQGPLLMPAGHSEEKIASQPLPGPLKSWMNVLGANGQKIYPDLQLVFSFTEFVGETIVIKGLGPFSELGLIAEKLSKK